MLISSKVLNGINGIAEVPGDKSISHRSIIIPSITDGICHIKNILKSTDVINTINAFKLMGVKIEENNIRFKCMQSVENVSSDKQTNSVCVLCLSKRDKIYPSKIKRGVENV